MKNWSYKVLWTFILIVSGANSFKVSAGEIPLSSLIVGRYETAGDHVLFDWPCVTVRADFVGSGSVHMRLNGQGNRFRVTVNGQSRDIETGFTEETILIADHLENGRHKVSVKKVTEAASFFIPFFMNQGVPRFYGFESTDQLALQISPSADKKIDFYGDSAMAGFGILGDSQTSTVACLRGMLNYEDCAYSWPSVVGRAIGADIHIQAWSGRGVVKNAAGLLPWSQEPFPVYWERSLATAPESQWQHHLWVPDLIVVGLGHNDFYNRPFPDETTFISGYRQFIESIKGANPQLAEVPMLVICGGAEWKNRLVCPLVKEAVKDLRAEGVMYRELQPEWFTSKDLGCLSHFNIQGNLKMADKLLQDIKEILK